jgi:hypothetical protein
VGGKTARRILLAAGVLLMLGGAAEIFRWLLVPIETQKIALLLGGHWFDPIWELALPALALGSILVTVALTAPNTTSVP